MEGIVQKGKGTRGTKGETREKRIEGIKWKQSFCKEGRRSEGRGGEWVKKKQQHMPSTGTNSL